MAYTIINGVVVPVRTIKDATQAKADGDDRH